MRIGEVAQRSDVSEKTLRYYESIGLLEPTGRTPAGYRIYDHGVLERLGFVRAAQALGLTLGEIRSIVALRDAGTVPCAHVVELLRARADDVDRTLRDLRELRRELRRLVDRASLLDPAACVPERVCHVIASDRNASARTRHPRSPRSARPPSQSGDP